MVWIAVCKYCCRCCPCLGRSLMPVNWPMSSGWLRIWTRRLPWPSRSKPEETGQSANLPKPSPRQPASVRQARRRQPPGPSEKPRNAKSTRRREAGAGKGPPWVFVPLPSRPCPTPWPCHAHSNRCGANCPRALAGAWTRMPQPKALPDSA